MSGRELEELKCYACKDSNRKVCVCQRNSSQFDDWANRYKKDLELYIRNDPALPNVRRYYFDPDGSYKKGTDHSFFNDLETFLNKQEENMQERLQGRFEYKFVEGEGIEVSDTDSADKTMFYLRSDQFGFSAPENGKYYPYDLYIAKHENKDKAIEQVITWISMSRTIGGSFLWSKSSEDALKNSFYGKYNINRGGTIIYDKSKYIQDRVDLTLWEIKDWYIKRNKLNDEKSILERQSILESCSRKKPDLEDWLGHFGDFETYIDFFMFGEFVESVDGFYNPINIITGKSDAPISKENGKNPEPIITIFMEFDLLKNMLETLNNKIVKRSIDLLR